MMRSRGDASRSPGTCVKRTVACLPLGPTEEDHDPCVPAHTEPGRRGLRVEHVHVSGPDWRAHRTMLKGKLVPLRRVDGPSSVWEQSCDLLSRTYSILVLSCLLCEEQNTYLELIV